MSPSDLEEKLKQAMGKKEIHLSSASHKEDIIQHVENIPPNRKSRAPYNFVPINEKVVWAECRKSDEYNFFNCFDAKRKKVEFNNTGYIDLEIETLGDMFIGHNKDKHPDFFSINKVIHIPGSSLRGLIRTYVEILSYGKFGSFDDRHLYFRTFASKSNALKDHYNRRTKGNDQKSRICKHVKAGYLKKQGPAYFIQPAQFSEKTNSHSGSQYKRYSGKLSLEHFQWKKIENNRHVFRSGEKFGLKKSEDIWMINPPDNEAQEIKLSDQEIQSFCNDFKRGGSDDKDRLTDLIAQLDKDNNQDSIIPCFYVTDHDDKGTPFTSFGHTKLFRLMYMRSTLQCLPKAHFENPENLDIPEAIFGRSEEALHKTKIKQLAGRIFFEDAPAVSKTDPSSLPEKSLCLLGPNPTSVQHYLVQHDTHINRLTHYDSPGATLRGNKLYWHKQTENQTENIKKSILSKLKPVTKGTGFKGRIRFENLSKVELGALLSALQLPRGCHHKIGMGKPKGLGSVRITPTLFLSNRENRYTELFEDLDNNSEPDFLNFCQAFNKYVLKEINETRVDNLWNTKRLTQFKHLLTRNHGINPTELRDQILDDFKQKKILPLPGNIIEEKP